MSNRVAQPQLWRMSRRNDDGPGVLVPYFTACFPDRSATLDLIRRADAEGVGAIEIGFPYSDSIADGPVIQSSFHRALENGFRIDDAWQIARDAGGTIGAPLVAMVSYSIVHRHGLARFLREAASSGFRGLIVPDVPFEESAEVRAAAREAGLSLVGMIAPRTTPDRRRAIAENAEGFVYLIAGAGTTGERREIPRSLSDGVQSVRMFTSLPICVGFGVSTPQQVRDVCTVADGAIVGSAIIKVLSDAMKEKNVTIRQAVEVTAAYLEELAQAAASSNTD